jgi:Tol biopolymer transport system component
MDLQGLLYSTPLAGGAAKQISTLYDEDSHPDWSAKGGVVAVQSYAGGTFHIWTILPDGTGKKQITTGHGDDREPRISPDGMTIAFASDRAFKGSYDIWTVNIATGALKQITSSDADEFEPTWSLDGKSLAFVSGAGIAGKSIESIDLASGKQHTIVSVDPATGRVEAPSFSPDGTLLSYIRYTGSGMVVSTARFMVVSRAGDHRTMFTGEGQDAFPFPAIWLSNSALLYTGDGHIFHVDLAAKSESQIPFIATIKSIRPEYSHKIYDFDLTATRAVKVSSLLRSHPTARRLRSLLSTSSMS